MLLINFSKTVRVICLAVVIGSCSSSSNSNVFLNGFIINSNDSTWQNRHGKLHSEYLALSKQGWFESNLFLSEDIVNDRFKSRILFSEDSLTLKYFVNEPLQFGELRNLGIAILKDHKLGCDFGVAKSTVNKIIDHFKTLYGNMNSIAEIQDYSSGVIEISNPEFNLRKRLEWVSGEIRISLLFKPFESSECGIIDSVSHDVYLTFEAINNGKKFKEDFKLYREHNKLSDVMRVEIKAPEFESQGNSVVLVQRYKRLAHDYYGYYKPISAIKFDISYKDKFGDEVLLLKDISFDFGNWLEPDSEVVLSHYNNVAVRRVLASEERNRITQYINHFENQLTASVVNLSVIYRKDEVLNDLDTL